MSPTRRIPPLWVRTRPVMVEVDRATKDGVSDVVRRRQEREAQMNCRPWPAPIDVSAARDTETPTERERNG